MLLRQLKRSSVSNDIDVSNLEENWKNLLLGVSRAYENFDQDLYLLERSMTISSQELMELNQKLELAQQIAHLGYWRFEKTTKHLTWSKELFSLTGFDPLLGSPKWDQVTDQMEKEDVLKINALLERAFTEGKEFFIEIPFKLKKNGQCIWHYVKGHPEISNLNDAPKNIQYISGIVIDITERKLHEQEMKKSHQQLLSLSRQAGMTEIATSILHNIGNVVNSANVSITILKENREQPYYEKLFQTANLLMTHKDALDVYLMQDERGKLIPNYLIKLTEFLTQIHQQSTSEIENINVSIAHIKEIVTMQKTISGTSGVIEKVFIPEVVDLALQMLSKTDNTQIIKTTIIMEKIPFIFTDKSKLLQILINLIRNAKYAVLYKSLNTDKTIDIIGRNTSNNIQITIKDNGVGISPEHMKHLFLFGFTTKKDGHGFGLHGSALLAKELGGSIKAASLGDGYGAKFTLTFPKKTLDYPKGEKQ